MYIYRQVFARIMLFLDVSHISHSLGLPLSPLLPSLPISLVSLYKLFTTQRTISDMVTWTRTWCTLRMARTWRTLIMVWTHRCLNTPSWSCGQLLRHWLYLGRWLVHSLQVWWQINLAGKVFCIAIYMYTNHNTFGWIDQYVIFKGWKCHQFIHFCHCFCHKFGLLNMYYYDAAIGLT